MAEVSVPPGRVVWLEGLPGAGKTTLADALVPRLRRSGRVADRLDGDEIRRNLSSDLGYDREGRLAQARRVAFLAEVLSRNGVYVVVALITPYEASREEARARLGDRLLEVHLACPLEVCEARDPKGMYRRARAGEMRHLTGVDDPFEPPAHPDLTLRTDLLSVEECAGRIERAL
jgi:adenylylsulfate kinase